MMELMGYSQSLTEKIERIGADTIMGDALNGNATEAINNIDDAIREYAEKESENSSENTAAAAVGSQEQLLQMMLNSKRHITPLKKDAKIGRNEPCPCGSGKKYKNCCLESGKYETYTR